MHVGGQLGKDWESIGSLGSVALRHVTVSDTGLWLLAGAAGAVYRSSNYGNSWSSATVGTSQLWGVAYGSGLFAVAQDAGNNLWTSPDGVTWTNRINASRDHHAINFNDGYFVLGSGVAGGDGIIYGSSAGTSWTSSTSVGNNSVQCGIYVSSLGRTFAAGVQYRYSNTVPTATPTWTSPTGLSGTVYQVAWSPTLGIAVAVTSVGIFSSTNLTSWTSRSSAGQFNNVAWCNNQFVAVGSAGKIYTSPDGITWTNRSIGIANALYGVVYYNACILVTGDSGIILRSQ